MNPSTLADDLRAEQQTLANLFVAQDPALYTQATPYYQWSALDILVHLWFTDHLALLALSNAARSTQEATALGAATTGLIGIAQFARMAEHQRQLLRRVHSNATTPAAILLAWQTQAGQLCDRFDQCAADSSVDWFGRSMKIARLIDARQMEVWAYGQDVFDLFQVVRQDTDRIARVADFAARTFRFAFANRGLPIPAEQPSITLTSPSGKIVTWNAPNEYCRIQGSMQDFCLVTTQRRNLTDTALDVSGKTARDWLAIAQCIAGPPLDAPAPGSRVWH